MTLAERLTTNAYREFCAEWSEDFEPRIIRKPSEWASQVRIMPSGGPVSGSHNIPYDHKMAPHAVEIMDAALDPDIRIVVNWSGVRESKTAICLNLMGWIVTDNPGGILDVHPIDDDVAKFSNDDIEPMIDLCLGGYFVEKKSRDTGRTIDYKKFKGGSVRIVSAGSITKFRSSTVAGLFLHEIDGYKEKESLHKAINRTKGLANAIIYLESTGTLAPTIAHDGTVTYNSAIHEWHDKGDMRKWFCRCMECGELQIIRYPQIQARDGDERAARYYCERCDRAHNEAQWRKMASGGIWYPTAGLSEADIREIERSHKDAKPKQREVRSYWRSGFSNILPKNKGYATKLHEFLSEGKSALSSMEAKKTWTNEIAAELWSPESEGEPAPAWKPIFERRRSYGLTVPQGGLFLTAFCDVQKYRLEVGWRAWGRNEESWGMDHVVIEGYQGDFSTWLGLCRELSRKWTHESGSDMKLGMSFIDGGKWPDSVYRFFVMLAAYFSADHPMHQQARAEFKGINSECLSWIRSHCRASKGFGQYGHPIVDRHMKTVGKVLKGHHLGTWEAKDRIYERLRMGDLPPEKSVENIDVETREGVMHYNEQFSEEYFRGLTLEKVTVMFEKGQEVRKYIDKISGNEPLDIEVGCLAAVRLYPRNWDMLAAELGENATIAKGVTQQPKPQAIQRQDRQESWATQGVKW